MVDGSGGTGATGGGGAGAGPTTTSPVGGGGSTGGGGTTSSSSGCVTPEDDMKQCTDDVCQPDGSTAHTPKASGDACNENGGAVCDAAGECVECNVAADCNDATKTCAQTKCVDVTCVDLELNGNETDLDCGGAGCSPCDDGLNCLVAGDCESGVCDADTLTCSTPACGDGVMQPGEVCDDSNTANCDGCRADCKAVETGCGDGFTCGAEICDDSNTANCDGCRADCSAFETGCGDGFTCGAEVCDDGNQSNGDGCDDGAGAACTISGCGNGMAAGAESCDDGDTDADDGCSATCVTEPGFDCTGTPSTCTTSCGDGVKAGAEACDDGDTDGGDGCDALCGIELGFNCTGTAPSTCASLCGDGLVVPGETCDQGNGNVAPGDGCDAACKVELGFACVGTPSVCAPICGDGVVKPGEQCDDGNVMNSDCCSSTCQVEPGCEEAEINDTCGAQNALPAFAGSPLATSVKGNINPVADLDFYTFTLAGPGVQSVRIETYFGTPGTCASTAANDTAIELRGTTCATVLASNDDGTGVAYCSLIDGAATAAARGLAAGTYSVRVARSPLGTQVPLAGYGLKVSILSTCGNGTTEPTEACDDGNTTSGDGCSGVCGAEIGFGCSGNPSVCVPLVCGNGMLEPTQACDDGNTTPGDGCSATCTLETGYTCTGMPSVCTTTCGDGAKAAIEGCDDGNVMNGDCCSSTCQVEAGCEAEPNNACGAQTALPAFSSGATTITGNINPATDLDFYSFVLAGPGVSSVRVETFFGSPGMCQSIDTNDTAIQLRASNCTTVLSSNDDGTNLAYCSLIDGTVTSAARNLAAGTYTVRVARSTLGTQVPLANYGLKVSILSACGNGILEPTEACDDTNIAAGDGCSATCQVEAGYACTGTPSACTVTCGNGTLQASESCDDSNMTAGDGCSATCTVESGYTCTGTPSACTLNCGNGVLNTGETCDQGSGNVAPGDGCSATCTIEAGYFCSGTPSVCLLPEINCNDGLDNNNGGGVDAADPTCALPAYFTACGAGENLLVIPAGDVPKVIPDNAPAGGVSTLNVTATGTIVRAALLVSVTHTWIDDVDLTLTSPAAVNFDVSSDNGGSGDNYTNTVFDSTCATPVAGQPFAAAPFSACYQPESSFAPLATTSITGAWKLKGVDDASAISGSITKWSLVFCATP